MRKLLGLAVILSFLCALAVAQDKTTTQKPDTTTQITKVEGAGKTMKSDCCSGEKMKEKSEGCGEGCGDCTGQSRSTGKAKSTTGTSKAKTSTAPKVK